MVIEFFSPDNFIGATFDAVYAAFEDSLRFQRAEMINA